MFESGDTSILLHWSKPCRLRCGPDRRDIDLRRATLHTIVGNTRHAEEVVARLTTPSMIDR